MRLSSKEAWEVGKEGGDTIPIKPREEASMQVWCSQRRGSGVWDWPGPLGTDSADKGEHEQRRRLDQDMGRGYWWVGLER